MNHLRYSTFGRIFLFASFGCSSAWAADWSQWGGEKRDFRSGETGLIAKWESSGPKAIWKRQLGEGYSAIVCADNTLYTLYRAGDEEHVVALDAETGNTKWDFSYAAPMPKDAETGFGKGPNATPSIVGDRLITVGFDGLVHCFDRGTGKPVWTMNLIKDHGGTFVKFGYSSSPLLYKDAVIFPTGAKGKSLMSFHVSDGKPRWSAGAFENSYSSPILVEIGGKMQVTLVGAKEILGFDADSGEQLWSHPYKNQWDTHCTTPVDCGDGRVFYPSFEGGVLLKLAAGKGGTEVRELWNTKKIGTGQTSVVCVGDFLYGAGGSNRSSFLCCVKLSDGEVAWRERVPPSNTVFADGKLIVLDEAGVLRLAKAGSEKYELNCEAQLLEAKAWTTPTLSNGRLYLRDQKNILAADLKGK